MSKARKGGLGLWGRYKYKDSYTYCDLTTDKSSTAE